MNISGIKTNQWNFVNAEDEVIGKVYCRTHEQAFEKLKIRFPSLYPFIKITNAGQVELPVPEKEKGVSFQND